MWKKKGQFACGVMVLYHSKGSTHVLLQMKLTNLLHKINKKANQWACMTSIQTHICAAGEHSFCQTAAIRKVKTADHMPSMPCIAQKSSLIQTTGYM